MRTSFKVKFWGIEYSLELRMLVFLKLGGGGFRELQSLR
jgi:hypothetical protein